MGATLRLSTLDVRRLVVVALAATFVVSAAAGTRTAAQGAVLRHAPLHAVARGGSRAVSVNWAGYVAAGPSFSHVEATWVEPQVACSGTNPLDASSFWIGLGGASYSSPGLEQAGTSADCAHGRARYYAWYEVLPAPATNVALPVQPGDAVKAVVDVTDGIASFTLTNLTSGAVFATKASVRFPATDSAEWIAEAPSVCRGGGDCKTLPLARFGAVLFTSATATAGTHTGAILDGGWSSEPIRLAGKSGPVSAAPSVLSEDGSSFSIATHGPRTRVLLPGLPVERLLGSQTQS